MNDICFGVEFNELNHKVIKFCRKISRNGQSTFAQTDKIYVRCSHCDYLLNAIFLTFTSIEHFYSANVIEGTRVVNMSYGFM